MIMIIMITITTSNIEQLVLIDIHPSIERKAIIDIIYTVYHK